MKLQATITWNKLDIVILLKYLRGNLMNVFVNLFEKFPINRKLKDCLRGICLKRDKGLGLLKSYDCTAWLQKNGLFPEPGYHDQLRTHNTYMYVDITFPSFAQVTRQKLTSFTGLYWGMSVRVVAIDYCTFPAPWFYCNSEKAIFC